MPLQPTNCCNSCAEMGTSQGLQFCWLCVFFRTYLTLVNSETADPNNAKVIHFYGPGELKSAEYSFDDYKNMVESEPFNQNKTTCFIPDYIESQLSKTNYTAQAYVEYGIINFLLIDYGTPIAKDENSTLDIDEDTVSQKIADWMMNLVPDYIPIENFDVVSYALGVNMAAKVARKIGDKFTIHRITALAPPLGTDMESSLATFVDAIYTDQEELGTDKDVGHANFRPNGGNPTQPGCHNFENLRCSTEMAWRFWAESVAHTNGTQFCAFKAKVYAGFLMHDKDFGNNLNKLEEALMGIQCDPSARGKFFLETNAKLPYAKGCPT